MTTLRDTIRANFTRTAILAGCVSVALELILLFGFPQRFSDRHSLLPGLCLIPTFFILWKMTVCPACHVRFGLAINRIIGRRNDAQDLLTTCPHCGADFDKPLPD